MMDNKTRVAVYQGTLVHRATDMDGKPYKPEPIPTACRIVLEPDGSRALFVGELRLPIYVIDDTAAVINDMECITAPDESAMRFRARGGAMHRIGGGIALSFA